MKTTLSVAMGYISSIQLGIWIAIYHPYHINPVNEDVPIVVPMPEEFEAVESNRKTATNGLSMFWINPLVMRGGGRC